MEKGKEEKKNLKKRREQSKEAVNWLDVLYFLCVSLTAPSLHKLHHQIIIVIRHQSSLNHAWPCSAFK
jgi:hypothetical protein